ncbi:MAG: hypothetical protein JWN63_3024 [Candidatus Acidoferrum typicum]|nr:hypothetical protein [Candidatus Acidoferrum typicum]
MPLQIDRYGVVDLKRERDGSGVVVAFIFQPPRRQIRSR